MADRKQTKATKPIARSGFVIGRKSFEKISAVEGIHLSPEMKKRAEDSSLKGLSADEIRRLIIRSHRKG